MIDTIQNLRLFRIRSNSNTINESYKNSEPTNCSRILRTLDCSSDLIFF